MKRTPLKRTPFLRKPKRKKESKGLFDHLKKPSKKEQQYSITQEFKERFYSVGIIFCELRLEGCTGAYNFGWTWSFAHSKKVGDRSTDPEQRFKEDREFAYSCGNCHGKIEVLPRDANPSMYDLVIAAINRRETQP